MNITGKLIEKFEIQQITDTFRKREFVIEYAENPQYPEFVKFELIQTNCEQLDNFEAGEEISIAFNLKGRKWTDPKSGQVKYFNSLQAWKLEKTGSGIGQNSNPTDSGTKQEKTDQANTGDSWMSENFSEDDDLPF